MSKNLLILGGYGNTGSKIAELLLIHTDVSLTLSGRNLEKAEALAVDLNKQFGGERVSTKFADASNPASLKKAFDGMDLVVVASGTSEYVREVATAALDSKIDHLDVQFSSQKLVVLRSMIEQIKDAGLCFITEAGFHPGLPAALVRYGAQYLDRLESAVVGSVIKQDWGNLNIALSTATEFVREITDFHSLYFKDGEWKKASMVSTKDFIEIEFMEPFDKQLCAPMFLEELREIPKAYSSLNHTGFYIAGFNKISDMIVMPFVMLMLKLFPNAMEKPMAKLMYWSLETFSKPPYATILKLEAKGEKNGDVKEVEIQLYHEDGYWFTAIPVVACLLQYLDESIKKPGLWYMGNLVEPNRLIDDMKKMGIHVIDHTGSFHHV